MNMPSVVMVFGIVGISESVCEFLTGHTFPGKHGPVRYVGIVEPCVDLVVGTGFCFVSFAWKRATSRTKQAPPLNQSTKPTLASGTSGAKNQSRNP